MACDWKYTCSEAVRKILIGMPDAEQLSTNPSQIVLVSTIKQRSVGLRLIIKKVDRHANVQRCRGRHRKSWTALVATLTLLSERSPIAKDPRIISWERIH